MMRKYARRGMPIGGYPSQLLANIAISAIDHWMKEVVRVKCYLRYCDDTCGRTMFKGQAKRQLREFNRISERLGLVVKGSAIVAPIGKELRNAKKKKSRKLLTVKPVVKR